MFSAMKTKSFFVLVRRAFEILLGLVLFVASLVPMALMAAGLVATEPGELPLWLRVVIILVSAILIWFCVATGSRLLTGRERPGGGLLHPWLLYVGAVLTTWRAVSQGLFFGPEYAPRHHEAADELYALARSRWRKSRSSSNPGPPNGGQGG
jgi:hypothetical protein